MIEALQEIDTVRLNFNNDGRLFLNLTIAFIMFGIALELKPEDFKKLLKSPKPAFVGVLSQFFLMPLLTFIIATLLGDIITPTIGMGMILVAACPGGNVSNFISSLAKGNVALSVSLTAFSSIGGLILTPFNFAFWGNLYLKFGASTMSSGLVQELQVDAVDVLQTIVLILGVPLVLGIFVSSKFPGFTASHCSMDQAAIYCNIHRFDWDHFRIQFGFIHQIHQIHFFAGIGAQCFGIGNWGLLYR